MGDLLLLGEFVAGNSYFLNRGCERWRLRLLLLPSCFMRKRGMDVHRKFLSFGGVSSGRDLRLGTQENLQLSEFATGFFAAARICVHGEIFPGDDFAAVCFSDNLEAGCQRQGVIRALECGANVGVASSFLFCLRVVIYCE